MRFEHQHPHHQAEPTAAPALTDEELQGWFAGRLPEGLFTGAPTITGDRDEILVGGEIPDVELAADTGDSARATARAARVERFRADTKQARIAVARDAERLFGRTISWGARCGDVTQHFTTLGVPVMTRLRLADRRVLDTLIDAGVARSRSEALAWCVRLVARHQGEWIDSLREALVHVEKVRSEGPDA